MDSILIVDCVWVLKGLDYLWNDLDFGDEVDGRMKREVAEEWIYRGAFLQRGAATTRLTRISDVTG